MNTQFSLSPVALVHNARTEVQDDHWGDVVSELVLVEELPSSSLQGLDSFSHVEILFVFHQVSQQKIVNSARHPRNNPDWPQVGIFAQRGKNRPNRLGSTIAEVCEIKTCSLVVKGLDAINGTPVLDIKPVFAEFLPQTLKQPAWVGELMKEYFSPSALDF